MNSKDNLGPWPMRSDFLGSMTKQFVNDFPNTFHEYVGWAAANIEQLSAERDRLAEENARLRMALQNIVDSYEASSELHTSSADCAANLYDHAYKALGKP